MKDIDERANAMLAVSASVSDIEAAMAKYLKESE